MMRDLSKLLAIVTTTTTAAIVACGGISDPTKIQDPMSPTPTLVKVSGALTGGPAVPADARVALVWRIVSTDTVVVTQDVPVVDGKFTIQLDEPPVEAFARAASAGAVMGGSNGQVNQTGGMVFAVAGFVVWADTNATGKLDVEDIRTTFASAGKLAWSSDLILGGNGDLLLTYFGGGGELDYESGRDRAGVRPNEGFNLRLNGDRWVPLDLVELKLSSPAQLPRAVCPASIIAQLPNELWPCPVGGPNP